MQRRVFPKIPDLPISTLGFGAMRLPTIGGDPARIDEERATRLLREAIAAGVNYVDTAWPYHGGHSEPFVGRALAGLRDRVQLATKCPVWEVKEEADFERLLDAQLRRLETSHVDFYLLHALSGDRWEHVRRLGGLEALERARADGRIRHLGFSFHGSAGEFRTILEGYDWEFTQLQLNYLDESYQAGIDGVRLAAGRGVGTIVMEPLRGGGLARVPPAVRELLARSGRSWSPAQWALRWCWSQPGVVTVLSGMNEPSQLTENVAAAAAADPLGPDDLAFVAEAKAFYASRMAVPCTTCGYCQPCPSGVAIPEVFSNWNSAVMFEDKRGPAWAYATFQLKNGAGADRCTACRECEESCPQQIAIPEKLELAHAALTSP